MTIRRLFPRAATAGLLALLCLLATIAPVVARLGRFLEAARDFTGAIAGSRPARPPSPDLYLERARALESAGDTRLEEALRGLEDGLALLGRPVALELAAADLERRLGRPG